MRTTKSCPKCHDTLQIDARACQCGWTLKSAAPKEEKERPVVHCAHETCDLPAICKIKTKTGWANLCEPHYVMHFDNEARQNFTERGLDRGLNETRDEHRKRVMAWIRGRMKPKTFTDAAAAEDEWAA